MKQFINRWLSVVLAIAIIAGLGVFALEKLKASEDDGTVTAVESQQIVEKQNQPVSITIPDKKETKQETPAKKKDEPAPETKPEPVKQEEPAVKEEPAKQEEPAVKEEPAAKEEPVKQEEPVQETEAPVEEPETAEEPDTQEPQPTLVAYEEPAETVSEPADETDPAETDIPDTAEPEATAEPATEEVIEPVEEKAEFDGDVIIEMTYYGELDYGSEITFTATIIGNTEDIETIQWQYNDGTGWKDIEGETGIRYTFVFTEENAGYGYRVEVN